MRPQSRRHANGSGGAFRVAPADVAVELYLRASRCSMPDNPGLADVLRERQREVIPVMERRFATATKEWERRELASALRALRVLRALRYWQDTTARLRNPPHRRP